MPNRRSVVTGLAMSAVFSRHLPTARAADSVTFSLNPLFLDSDIQLPSMMQTYLIKQLGKPVQLVKRRTYQEITAMLLSVAKAYELFDEAGRMKPSPYYERVVDVMEELMKFTLLTRDRSAYLTDRYSERREAAIGGAAMTHLEICAAIAPPKRAKFALEVAVPKRKRSV